MKENLSNTPPSESRVDMLLALSDAALQERANKAKMDLYEYLMEVCKLNSYEMSELVAKKADMLRTAALSQRLHLSDLIDSCKC